MVTLKRYSRYLLTLSALTALTAAVTFLVVQRSMSAQGRVAFTALAVHSIYKPSGQVVLTEELVLATRSDGSTVRVRNVVVPHDRGGAAQKTVVDLSRAEEVHVDGLTESLTTYPLPRRAVEYLRRRPPGCTGDGSALRSTMLGFDVVQAVQGSGGAGSMLVRREEWRAPALDCFPLKEVTFRGRSGTKMYLSSVTEVSQVTVGEPAAPLFERPAGYVERSPSARRLEYNERYPERAAQLCQGCLQADDQRSDQIYLRRQADRGK